MEKRPIYYDVLIILIGAGIALVGTILSELWLIPAKQNKIHAQQLIEYKLSKLYTPLIIATGKGQFSMTGDIIFYKVHEIMEEYGYLSDDEVINKYIEFFGLCRFAGFDELLEGSLFSEPLSRDVILEIAQDRAESR